MYCVFYVCVHACVAWYGQVSSISRCVIAEAQSSTVDSDSTPRSLKTKLVTLGQAHYPSEKYFPLSRIIKLLEQLGCQKNWNVKFVYQTMREIGVSFVDLLPLYDYLFKARVRMYIRICSLIHS